MLPIFIFTSEYYGKKKNTSKNHLKNLVKYLDKRDNAEPINEKLEPEELDPKENIVGYMANRPRAERIGNNHALFTEEGADINLKERAKEVSNYDGYIFSHVLSLTREDAVRLGYDNSKAWKNLIDSKIAEIAKGHKIPIENLKYCGAFHNEGHHPHCHLLVYSKNPKDGYLTEYWIEKLRGTFAREISRDEMYNINNERSKIRDLLSSESKLKIQHHIENLNNKAELNPELKGLIIKLSEELKETNGKKVYGFLSPERKEIVDNIVDLLAEDEDLKIIFNNWYELKEQTYEFYMKDLPPRRKLSELKEFTKIKNAVIRSVNEMNYEMEKNEKLNNSSGTDINYITTATTRLMKNIGNIFQQNNNAMENKLSERIDKKEFKKQLEKKRNQGIKY